MPFDPIGYVERPQVIDRVGAVLLDAADYLEKFGWLQNEWGFGFQTARCVMGAIGECDHGFYYNDAKERLGATGLELIAWNNTPGRTKEEVIARLRNAAYA